MSLVKSHSQDFFYKYFDFDGAKKTLENRTFLYKAPAFFNDPFDSQLTLQPGLSENEIGGIFFEVIAEAILEKRIMPRLGLTAEALATMPPGLDREGLNNIKDGLLAKFSRGYFTNEHRRIAEEQVKFFQENFRSEEHTSELQSH